jgi:hypothetical protein
VNKNRGHRERTEIVGRPESAIDQLDGDHDSGGTFTFPSTAYVCRRYLFRRRRGGEMPRQDRSTRCDVGESVVATSLKLTEQSAGF